MTTVICPECKKHDNIQPIEHPSDKEKVYFKCNDCGAMFDDKGNMAKFIGGVVGGAAAVGSAIWALIEIFGSSE